MKHYHQHRRTGTVDEVALAGRQAASAGSCHCGRATFARQMCYNHWYEEVRAEKGKVARKDLWDTTIAPGTVHNRARRLWGSASQYPCVECGNDAAEWAYDGTDPTQLYARERPDKSTWLYYSRFPEFYMPMCKKCHRIRDKRKAAEELHAYRMLVTFKPTEIARLSA